MSNPFIYGRPVPADKMVGLERRKRLETIATSFISPSGDSHLVIGGRRFGKSSFLMALKDKLLRQIDLTKQDQWHIIPIYINLQRQPAESSEKVFGFMLQRLCEYFNPSNVPPKEDTYFDLVFKKTKVSLFVQDGNKECAREEFAAAIKEVATYFRLSYGNLRIVFLIDEIEEILDKGWTPSLFNYLRTLIYDEDMPRDHICYVVAGTSKVYAVRQQGSKFLNMLKLFYLRVLDKDSILEMIHWAGHVPADVADMVVKQCGGHPFIAQYLMYHLYENGISQTTINSVEERTRIFIHEHDGILREWQSCIPEPGLATYNVLMEAEMEDGLTETHILKRFRMFPLEALKALCYHGLIDHDGTWKTYRVVGEAFKSWFELNILPSLSHNHVTPKQINLFYLYAHKDKALAKELEKQLDPLRTSGLIEVKDCDDGNLGFKVQEEIKRLLESAHIILLLVSPDLMNSTSDTYAFIEEVKSGLLTARVVPVILRPCEWKPVFGNIWVLPRDQRPISTLKQHDQAFTEVAQEVKRVVEELNKPQ